MHKIQNTETEQKWNWPEEDFSEDIEKIVDSAQDDAPDERDMQVSFIKYFRKRITCGGLSYL